MLVLGLGNRVQVCGLRGLGLGLRDRRSQSVRVGVPTKTVYSLLRQIAPRVHIWDPWIE